MNALQRIDVKKDGSEESGSGGCRQVTPECHSDKDPGPLGNWNDSDALNLVSTFPVSTSPYLGN